MPHGFSLYKFLSLQNVMCFSYFIHFKSKVLLFELKHKNRRNIFIFVGAIFVSTHTQHFRRISAVCLCFRFESRRTNKVSNTLANQSTSDTDIEKKSQQIIKMFSSGVFGKIENPLDLLDVMPNKSKRSFVRSIIIAILLQQFVGFFSLDRRIGIHTRRTNNCSSSLVSTVSPLALTESGAGRASAKE